MNCDEARGLRLDSLLDRIDSEEATRLEAHERDCPACAAAAREATDLWNALGGIDAPSRDADALVRFGRELERRNRPSWRSKALVAAGVAALVVGGAAVGRWSAGAATEDLVLAEGTEYLMLLRGSEPDRRVPQARLRAEYGAWAGELASAGALVQAAELATEEGGWVRSPETPEDPAAPVSGYFLVRTADYESAVALARASPHVAYGGSIEVRRVESAR